MAAPRARFARVLVSASLFSLLTVGFRDLPASATVTQVDGVVLPTGNSLQGYFDANDPQVQAVRDAAEQPQVFLPRTTAAVVFRDLIEDAGFENSFGWYNVGDDIFTTAGRAANLHPVFGCGVQMLANPTDTTRQHRGNPNAYVPNAEPTAGNNQVSVDFAAEQTAGRYKGGFIGLYMITPEGNGGTNCGDFKNDGAGRTLFGHIYFSQKDLNDDGDYVHNLVYTSQVNPALFYFGFEDRFRGNDNDFNDMFMSIDGLKPPCVPTAELCDGKDNDCDGQIDAADPDLSGVGTGCLCDGVNLPCSDGVVFGVCQPGVTVCLAGQVQCDARGAPTSEQCNGVDDDCDGQVDDNAAGTGLACDGRDEDSCPEGVTVCEDAQLVCNDETGTTVETCNGLDDDCDGQIDEHVTDEGASCGSGVGVCRPGTQQCMGGHLECVGAQGGGPEVCNNLDDDCDGLIDTNDPDLGGVGVACGQTDTGECALGETVCAGGRIECVGAVGPVAETCNQRDDDCDGVVDDDPVDVGQPCGSDTGECEPGQIVCTPTGPLCEGGRGPHPEECDRLDNDCNGIVDDDPAGVGGTCGTGQGVCEPGVVQCIDGRFECVGGFSGTVETCNGIDDDCDGIVDDGELCGDGVCDHGQCASPCSNGEFPCPIGQICEAGYCIQDPCADVHCPPGPNGESQVCENGTCFPRCEHVSCTDGRICRPTDGLCVPNNCDFLPLCTDQQLCIDGACVSDPCAGVDCPADQFCRGGSCIGSCAGVPCPAGEACHDGACVATGCTVDCPTGQVCDRDNASCVDDPCARVHCDAGDVCDPATGTCVDDPCIGVHCPGDQICRRGDCFERNPPPPTPDAGPKDLVTAAGGGCDAGGGGGGWLIPLVAALLLVRRRRILRAAAMVAAIATVAGCNVNDYCVNCAVQDGAAPPVDAATPDGPEIDGPPAPGCDAGVQAEEICNDVDDDCDGHVDEGFDLTRDRLNCGACGHSCARDGTFTRCEASACEMIGCAPGRIDIDGDLDQPFDQSNGCEYGCFVSNGGAEACDRLDNDCDSHVDEDTHFDRDPLNCGQCGRVCSFFGAVGHCVNSSCGFDPAVDCRTGFHDVDHDPANGCEYQCTPSQPSVEACDVVDNDCDGRVDETFDLEHDPQNCGACGRACAFPRVAMPRCTPSGCGFGPTDCDTGFVDANGRQGDGCEYQCTRSNNGVERCDGLDNDCDGVIDDLPVDAGGACSNAPGGTPTGACTATGTLVCTQGALVCANAPTPSAEQCNGTDDDCDGHTDEGADHNAMTRECYGGPDGTAGVGTCRRGVQACTGGQFGGPCIGEVDPTAELCDSRDQDCDGHVDESPTGGGPLSRSCYTGTAGTAGVGVCHAGTQVCGSGSFGACFGQVVDVPGDACGDGLDTDCDGANDAGEGCLLQTGNDVRLDAPGGAEGSTPGQDHSLDLALAAGGNPRGSRLYAVWTDLGNGAADVFFRASTDGGTTWGDILNLTGSISAAAVEPFVVVAPGAGAGGADRIFVVYQTFTGAGGTRDVQVQRSNNGGTSFDNPSGALDDANGDSFHHHAAVSSDGQTVDIVWERLDTSVAALPRSIRSRTSTNGGTSYGAERTVDVGSGATPRAGRPQVAITSTGRHVWVWREARAGATNDVFAAVSDSATAAPAADRRLDGDSAQTRDADTPQLKVSGQRIYVVWQDIATQAGQGSDILIATSTDNGGAWSSERILDDPAGEVSASFSPSLAVAPGAGAGGADRVAVAWEDRREGTQAFVAMSNNSGSSFAAAVRASRDGNGPVAGQTLTPLVAFANGGQLVVAYINDRGGRFHAYTASSVDAGVTWVVTDVRLDTGTGNALTPVVAQASTSALPSAIAVGWIDFRTNGVRGDPFVRLTGR